MTDLRYAVITANARFAAIGRRTLNLYDAAPGKTQGAIHRVAFDRYQPALHVRGEPRLHRRCQSAEQGNARRAAFREPTHQFIDLLRGVPHDPPSDPIASVGMTHH